jgi:SAM-dependent methyltransferase
LASLSTGYYIGGQLADRRPGASLLARVVVLAGALLALTPLAHRPVLGLGESLGIRLGPLLSAALLFSAPLVTLGMVAPISIRVAMKNLSTAGRGVGSISAASTLGSLVGTLAVAFVAIPAYDATTILAGTAALLILVGGSSLARRHRLIALGLLVLPVLIGSGPPPHVPDGFVVIARSQSLLGKVQVIDDQSRGVRFLRSDHSILGATYQADGSPAFAFVSVLGAVRFFHPLAQTCLNIGLGTGAVPTSLEKHGIRVDAVEIDPAVVELARQHFDYRPRGTVEIGDARAFLQTTEQRYDLVVHDTFTGGATPEHLLSLEVLNRIRHVLNPGGVLALNFAGFYSGPDAAANHAVARTVKAAFKHVRAFRDAAPDPKKPPIGNTVFFASDRPLALTIPSDAVFDNDTQAQVVASFSSWPVFEQLPAGDVITDARNPLGRLQISIADEHFKAMNELLPVELWLN